MEVRPSTVTSPSPSALREGITAAWHPLPATFETSFRRIARRTPNDALCVLDVTPTNIYEFEQGRIELFLAELVPSAAVPVAATAAVSRLIATHRVCDALRMRRELINFKKVMLHVHAAAMALERELRRAASVLYCKLSSAPSLETERYLRLCVALAQLKGASLAANGARRRTKAVCTVHRHPEACLPASTRALVELKAATAALRFAARIDTQEEKEAEDSTASSGGAAGGASAEASAVPPTAPPSPSLPPPRWDALRDAVRALAAARSWPPHASHFIECALIARGVAKALTMVDELESYGRALTALPAAIDRARQRLGALQQRAAERSQSGNVPREALPNGVSEVGVHASRHLHTLAGVEEVGCDTLHWVEVLLAIATSDAPPPPHSTTTLFLGGDGIASMTVPPGFHAFGALQRARDAALRARPAVAARIAGSCWPPALGSSEWSDAVAGSQGPCGRCGGRFTSLFLEARTGFCTRCAAELRALGVCPGAEKRGTAHPARAWCPHEQRCFACDRHSCARCRLWRAADGDAAHEIVAAQLLSPEVGGSRSRSGSDSDSDCAAGESPMKRRTTRRTTLMLDFDRTLCTTRSGNPPDAARHRIDAGLVALAARVVRTGGRVAVVTRNGHRDAIRAFLVARMPLPGGVEAKEWEEGGVGVRCVKREKIGKGDVVREALARDGAAAAVVFIDDDIAEHTNDVVFAEDERVYRILFCP